MTTPRHVNPPTLYRDAPYDYATVAPSGRLVFTAGACPLGTDGTVIAPGDLEIEGVAVVRTASEPSTNGVRRIAPKR